MKNINSESIDPRYSSEELLYLLLDLLTITTPFGNEGILTEFLPIGGYYDEIGNYIIEVGTDSQTLFCCHMDTVGSKQENVNPLYVNGFISSKITKSCLGGDDRCGMLCCIAMIDAEVPGTYIFHVGEERGAVGANYIASNYNLSGFKRAIEFDRRGTTSVITDMSMSPVCSNEFALDLCSKLELNFIPDSTGIFTDVCKYKHIIPEVTNLSTGYYNEHSPKEKINADWLIYEFIPALINLDWENLITERDPLKEELEYQSSIFSYKDSCKDYYNNKHLNKGNIDWSDFEFEDLDDEELDFFNKGNEIEQITCAFCEKFDEGDFKDLIVDGDVKYLCFDCYDYLDVESTYGRNSREYKFKCLMPEFEQYSQLE